MKKTTLALALLAIAVIGVAALPRSAGAASNGQQIFFVMRNARFTSLQITGTNQYGSSAVWQAPYRGENGTSIAITRGWWWKDFVRLEFYIPNVGWRGCLLDYIGEGYDYQLVTYTLGESGCTGDHGNAYDPFKNTVQAYINTLFWKEENLGLVDSLGTASDALECLEGLAGHRIAFGCMGVAGDQLEELIRESAR